MDEILRMKIAVSVACIALKPPNISAEEFVKQLSIDYQTKQEMWKDKYCGMETEILHLKQELLMSRSAFPNFGSEMVESQEILPTPPLSGGASAQCVDAKSSDVCMTSIQKHTRFLQSVVFLQKACKGSSTTVQGITESSIRHCLQIFHQCIGDNDCVIPMKSLQNCARLITQVMGNNTRSWSLLTKAEVENIIHTIVNRLCDVKCQQSGQRERWEDKQMLLDLTRCLLSEDTVKGILTFLLKKLEGFSLHLRQVCKGTEKLDVCLFNNTASIVDLFLIAFEHPCHNNVTKDRDFLRKLRDQLEDSLLHITEKFPLYAHAVWKICGRVDTLIYSNRNT